MSSALNLEGDNQLEVTLDDRLTRSTVPGGPTDLYLAAAGQIAYTFPIAWESRPGIIRAVSLVYSNTPVFENVQTRQSFNADLSAVDLTVTIGVAGGQTEDLTADVALARNGTVVGTCSALPSGLTALACTIRVENPTLWSPSEPSLYDLSINLLDRGSSSAPPVTIDAGRDRIGFRKFEARGPRFYLNNRPTFLRGVARHDLYGANGHVADETTIRQDLIRIRSLGINFIRCIHYPPDEAFVRWADEYGMLLSEEIPAWANLDSPDVIEIASSMMRSLAARDVNRASVVMYMIGSLNISRAPYYVDALIPLARSVDESRLISFVYDDDARSAERIADNASYAQQKGADFHSQNTYWHSAIFEQAAPGFPTDIPFLATEWTGAEGSDRGPIGSGDTQSFPSNMEKSDGVYPESYEALQMVEAYRAFAPYVCNEKRPTKCIAGTVYFNWQDVLWPGMPYFYPNHYPMNRNGLVYEDRVQKSWPMLMFQYLTATLPQ
ncbi:MAG: hypothetical protein IPP47_07395 [Bryobacterales bacterium]|nr:hypothetical protein [Bryobacterales bacterium]